MEAKDILIQIFGNDDRHYCKEEKKQILRQAAVLIPLIKREGQWHMLFEVRSHKLNTQPGEICFPGGKMESGESPMEAAVRETCEELLVSEGQISVLEVLDGLDGPKNRKIIPVVAVLDGYDDTYSEAEVSEVFSVPVKWFLEQSAEEYEVWNVTQPDEKFPYERIPEGRNYPWSKSKRIVYFYQYGERTIWGLTAHIVVRFLKKHKKK